MEDHITKLLNIRRTLGMAMPRGSSYPSTSVLKEAFMMALDAALDAVDGLLKDDSLWDWLKSLDHRFSAQEVEDRDPFAKNQLANVLTGCGYTTPPPPPANELVNDTAVAVQRALISVGDRNSVAAAIDSARWHLRTLLSNIRRRREDTGSAAGDLAASRKINWLIGRLLPPVLAATVAGAAMAATDGAVPASLIPPAATVVGMAVRSGSEELVKHGSETAIASLIGWFPADRAAQKAAGPLGAEPSAVETHLAFVMMEIEVLNLELRQIGQAARKTAVNHPGRPDLRARFGRTVEQLCEDLLKAVDGLQQLTPTHHPQRSGVDNLLNATPALEKARDLDWSADRPVEPLIHALKDMRRTAEEMQELSAGRAMTVEPRPTGAGPIFEVGM